MIPLAAAVYYSVGFIFITIAACAILAYVASIGKAKQ